MLIDDGHAQLIFLKLPYYAVEAIHLLLSFMDDRIVNCCIILFQ